MKFPKGTSQAKIQEKSEIAQKFLKQALGKYAGYQVHAFDDSMRIVTSVDNPWLLVSLFTQIGGESLAKKYIQKAAVNLDISI